MVRVARFMGRIAFIVVSCGLVATVACAADSVFTSKPVLLQEQGAGEGPAWHPELGLLTSGDGNINRRDKTGKTSVFRKGAGTNGLMFDRQQRLIACEPVQRRVTRTEADGTITVLASQYKGKRFNQPNDLTMDSKNRIYFSDPCYGDRSSMELLDAKGKPVEGVYRIDPDGTVTQIIAHEVDRPNGLVVTADDKYLFVADNNNNNVGGARKLWRFELQADGNVDFATQKLIHDWKTTRGPDGMKLDSEGRLYVAAGLNKPNLPHETADPPTAGIYVFSPEGQLLEFVAIPRDETTNCAFGGDDLKTLFVTAGGTLWSVQTVTAGATATATAAISKPPIEEKHPLYRHLEQAYKAREVLKPVTDYEAVFTKRELIGRRLIKTTMNLKLREEPFSVYLKFLDNSAGREVIYMQGRDNNNLVVHEAGIASIVGTLKLPPTGRDAMSDNRYPVTMIGLKIMLDKVISQWETEGKMIDVKTQRFPDATLPSGESCIAYESTVPTAREQSKFHVTRLWIDKQTNLAIRVEQHGFPGKGEKAPPVIEEYTYTKLKLNPKLVEKDFDIKNPAYAFP